MFAHIYRADGREEDIELDYCYSDEEAAIAVCEDGDFGSGDRAIVCVTRWDSTRKRFMHRMVRVAVKGNEIHLVLRMARRRLGGRHSTKKRHRLSMH